MKVLWLASWFPSRVHLLAGDFVERHARAAALFDSIYVLHVVKDDNLVDKRVFVEEKRYGPHLTALIIYYPAYRSLGKWVEKVLSAVYYIVLHFKGYSYCKNRWGKPDGLLVQVGLKAGLMALLFRYLFGLKYILFERWTGWLEEAVPNYKTGSAWLTGLWRMVLRRSVHLVTVSDYFGKAINRLHVPKPYTVVPNMIDLELFYASEQNHGPLFRFIHISTLTYQKNFEDILRAFRKVVHSTYAVELVVYGKPSREQLALTDELGLSAFVRYRGEVLHREIARALQQSHALILYSRFETFGNVLIEANACGLPVIVSDHPVFAEIVEEGITGLAVPGDCPDLLAEKMEWLMRHYHRFDPVRISERVRERYHPAAIGTLFHDLFRKHFR
ncbi:MAG TPA: glycosyltransferase family 4 protein [Chitinophagaceae bacterium]|jgi:glycosyltransferase involved in cell wall biosynthesis|nr:glycosyltransferase family 4 protein [Chitinophagaceae bacterium]